MHYDDNKEPPTIVTSEALRALGRVFQGPSSGEPETCRAARSSGATRPGLGAAVLKADGVGSQGLGVLGFRV